VTDFLYTKVDGEQRIGRAINNVVRAVSAPIRKAARPLEDRVFLMVAQQYDSNGRRGPTGHPWTRQQSTIDRETAMNRRGFTVLNMNMQRTGNLRTSETRRGAPHSIEIIEDDSITLGTDLEYGLIQQRRGQTQYDPVDSDVADFGKTLVRSVRGEITSDGWFDYVERPAIPF
jgi:hypothetical protein